MKKRTFIISSITCLALSLGSVAFASVLNFKGMNNFTRATTDVEGSVTFSNNGHNVTEYAALSGKEGFYDYVTHANLHDGTDIYMRVYDSKKLEDEEHNPQTDRVANMYCSLISFTVGDTNTSPFHFQEIASISFQTDTSRDFAVRTSLDGSNFQEQYIVSNEVGSSGLVLGGVNYVELGYYSFMDTPIFNVTINYSCSYSYVEDRDVVTIYATNDFHGAIEETSEQCGLEIYGTYLKQVGSAPNTLIIDQGDSWQGSIYSNMNYGKLVNDVMIEAGFDARTIGNHDFDWGIQKLKDNTSRTYKGQTLTTLGANIYDYNFNTKEFGTTQQADLGDKTVSYLLPNGLKVGIVGIIGYSQITSINSLYTHDIGFKPHIQVIKDEATALRNDGCDIVIASCHTGQEELLGNSLENYVDLVLCGHTHKFESKYSNGIWYGQFGENGNGIGKIELIYDNIKGKVIGSNLFTIRSYSIKDAVNDNIDPTIHTLVQNVKDAVTDEANQVVANAVGFPSDPMTNQVWIDTRDDLGLPYYTYNGTQWNYTGRIIRDQDLEYYHYWYRDTSSWPVEGNNGHYYINTDTGEYYVYENSAFNKLGCLIGDHDPETTLFSASDSRFLSNNTAENLMAQAIYDEAIKDYPDILCSYVNYARTTIVPDSTTHNITFADIYEAFPFDNAVYIIEASGREIFNQVKNHNFARFNDDFVSAGKTFDIDGTYKIAILDYLAFHTNDSRSYDYFSDNNGNYVGVLDKNYRIILKDWLHEKGYDAGKGLCSAEYNSNLPQFKRNNISPSNKYTVTFMMNDGSSSVYDTIENLSYGAVMPSVPNPTRTGYTFNGWYLDAECTRPVSASYNIYSNLTVYAGWREGEADLYYTGNIVYTDFTPNTYSTDVVATNSSSQNLNLTIHHSEILNDFSYQEFRVASGGYFTLTVPEGYLIRSVELKKYQTKESVDFYADTEATGSKLWETRTPATASPWWMLYNVEVNNRSLYMVNTDTSALALHYFSLVIEKVS